MASVGYKVFVLVEQSFKCISLVEPKVRSFSTVFPYQLLDAFFVQLDFLLGGSNFLGEAGWKHSSCFPICC